MFTKHETNFASMLYTINGLLVYLLGLSTRILTVSGSFGWSDVTLLGQTLR
jgi:hypothetical protein